MATEQLALLHFPMTGHRKDGFKGLQARRVLGVSVDLKANKALRVSVDRGENKGSRASVDRGGNKALKAKRANKDLSFPSPLGLPPAPDC